QKYQDQDCVNRPYCHSAQKSALAVPPTTATLVSVRDPCISTMLSMPRNRSKEDGVKRQLFALPLALGLLGLLAPLAEAQTPGEVFRKVSPSVVVIRAKGRDISTSGQSRFAETGSGVLISPDGKVMTAAHVVHAMDEISIEFLGGETVKAKVVASLARLINGVALVPLVPAVALGQDRTWEWQWHPMWFMWGAGGLVMMLMMFVFWGLVIAGLVVGLRWLAGQGRPGHRDDRRRRRR